MFADVKNLYDRHRGKSTRLSPEEIAKVLESETSRYLGVYVVVDAPSECDNDDGQRIQLLYILHETCAAQRIRSRPLQDRRSIPGSECTSVIGRVEGKPDPVCITYELHFLTTMLSLRGVPHIFIFWFPCRHNHMIRTTKDLTRVYILSSNVIQSSASS